MVSLPPLPQETIDFIDEDNGWLTLSRQTKHSRDELIAFTVPLVREDTSRDIDESCSGLLRKCFREHGFPAPWGAIQ